jgi:hypothetical protein
MTGAEPRGPAARRDGAAQEVDAADRILLRDP